MDIPRALKDMLDHNDKVVIETCDKGFQVRIDWEWDRGDDEFVCAENTNLEEAIKGVAEKICKLLETHHKEYVALQSMLKRK